MFDYETPYRVFLDDTLKPQDIFECTENEVYQNNEQWNIVKSISEFEDIVGSNFEFQSRMPDLISFSHDIGDVMLDSLSGTAQIGIDAIRWLVKFCELTGQSLPECIVHERNTIKARNLQLYIDKQLNK